MNKNFNVNFILFYLSKLEFRKKIRLKYEQKKLEIKITRYDIFYTKIKKKRQDFVVRNRKKKKKKMSFVIVESSYSERENKSSMCMSEKCRMCCQSVDLCTLCGHHISLFAF